MEEINTNQKLEVVETNEIERNIQEQKTIIPISQAMQEEKALTLKDFGGDVDKLYIAHEKCENVKLPNWLKETEKGIEIMPQLLFQHIIENEHILSVKSDNSDSIELYRYDKRGFYKKWGASECKPYIKSFLPTRIRNPYHWKKIFEELKTEFPNTEVSELNADENIINFQNGILDLTTGELLPHSPKYLTTIQIQCNYKPNLPLAKAPITQRFLIDLTGGNVDDIATILEAIGIINSNIPAWKFKKLIILQGKGNTGKSVLREVVTDIVGEENTFTIDVNDIIKM